MQKFFVEDDQIENNKATIIGEDVKHILNVLRMKQGETIQIGNRQKIESYIAIIEIIEKEKIIAKILEKNVTNNESNIQIDLYQGLPKADKMEWIIQKTTEIGINKIIPVDMIRCVVKLNEKDTKKKLERWQKIAEGAAKQSKRDKIPMIENKIKLKDIEINNYDYFIIAYEEETIKTLNQVLNSIKNKENYTIGILIGPEGGIDNSEIEQLRKNGAITVSLGKRILRTETAPIVMVSNIMYELEE